MANTDLVPVVDVLGEPYVAETIELPDDDEGGVVATLVSRRTDRTSPRAVLHVHGFADYFFQTAAADYWVGRGYDFYALDLRKYGRSLRAHQTPNFVADLADYYAELDEALRRVGARDGHDHVVVSAHSTGGLVTPLWAHDRPPRPGRDGAQLALAGPAGQPAAAHGGHAGASTRSGRRRPYLAIPRDVSGLYARSLHRDHEGEWDFDLAWKPLESWPVYAGWLRAVRRGHARVHRGLAVPAPVLVLTSDASGHPQEYDETCTSTDIVLDVELIRQVGPPARPTTSRWCRSAGAMHDVTLSREPVRTRVFDEISRWLTPTSLTSGRSAATAGRRAGAMTLSTFDCDRRHHRAQRRLRRGHPRPPRRPGRALSGLVGGRPGVAPDRGALVLGHDRRGAARRSPRTRSRRPPRARRRRAGRRVRGRRGPAGRGAARGRPVRAVLDLGRLAAGRRLRHPPPGAGGRRAPLGRRPRRRAGRWCIDAGGRRRLRRRVPALLGRLRRRPGRARSSPPLQGTLAFRAHRHRRRVDAHRRRAPGDGPGHRRAPPPACPSCEADRRRPAAVALRPRRSSTPPAVPDDLLARFRAICFTD